MITVICAWCKKLLGQTPNSTDLISHGICEDCRAKFLEDNNTPERTQSLET